MQAGNKRLLHMLKVDYTAWKSKVNNPGILTICAGFFGNSGYRAVVLYRIGNWFRRKKMRLCAVFTEKLMHHLCNCWISTNAIIDEGFVIRHVGCIVIGGKVKIGKYCDIRQGITIGGNMGKKDEEENTQPTIEDHVLIGAGAQVLGPIKIASNVIIGANAVVINSFPANSVVGGIPARLLKVRTTNE